jgi:hypothetical protein
MLAIYATIPSDFNFSKHNFVLARLPAADEQGNSNAAGWC